MVGKLRVLLSLVFSKAPDVSTPEGRSQDRYRRAAWTAMASMLARVLNILVGFITVPLTLGYLGRERFGLWMTLTSAVAFLTFTDMGLGIGLQNALTDCHGRDDRESPRTFVSSGLLAMLSVFAILVLTSVFLLPSLPLDRLVRTDDPQARNELLPTAQAVLICFGLGLPMGLIDRIYSAHQQGYWSSLWMALGRALSLVGVLVCIWMKLGLPWLAAAATGLPFISLLSGGVLFFMRQPWLIPSISAIRYVAFRQILQIGMTAVLAQVGCVIIYSGPALVIANRLGAAEVTPFSVTQKLVSTAGILLTTLVLPLWPAYGEAAARGDWTWITKTIRRTLRVGYAIQLPVFAFLLIAGRWIIRLWAGPGAVPEMSLLLAVNIWYLIAVTNLVTSIALNGTNHIFGQATYGLSMALVGLGVAYWVAPTAGVSGIVWSVACISIGATAILQVIELRRIIGATVTASILPPPALVGEGEAR